MTASQAAINTQVRDELRAAKLAIRCGNKTLAHACVERALNVLYMAPDSDRAAMAHDILAPWYLR